MKGEGEWIKSTVISEFYKEREKQMEESKEDSYLEPPFMSFLTFDKPEATIPLII